jgi:hypothetical protein
MKKVDCRRMWTGAIGVFAAALTGYASSPPESMDTLFQKTEFHAPLGTILTAQTGGAAFVEGTFIKGEIVTLSQDMNILLPGGLRIPFPVSIRKGQLQMTSVRGGWKYFCAKDGEATASFPALGSVISSGDCVGVRQSTGNGSLQWVVDNSNYNHSTTIWTRSIAANELSLLNRSTTDEPFSAREMTRIIFDGLYGGQFHFTFEEMTAGSAKRTKEFVFDRGPSGQAIVGIRGKIFRIVDANNIQMAYEWVQI